MRQVLLLMSVVFFALFTTACSFVPSNTAAVNMSFSGSLAEQPVGEGVYPCFFSTYIKVPLNANVFESVVLYGADNMAVSSDRQGIGYSINLSWQVSTPQAARQLLYHINRDTDLWVSQIITPSVEQAVKSIFVRYTLRDILIQRDQVGGEVASEILLLVEERLVGIDPSLSGAIDINQVVLTNLDYDDDLRNSIEQTQIVAQEQIRARENLETQSVNMQLTVRQAQAERQAAVERATGEAEAMRIRTAAIQDQFYSIAAAGVNPNLYIAASRWDGQLPTMIAGDTSGGDFTSLLVSVPSVGRITEPAPVEEVEETEGSATPPVTGFRIPSFL